MSLDIKYKLTIYWSWSSYTTVIMNEFVMNYHFAMCIGCLLFHYSIVFVIFDKHEGKVRWVHHDDIHFVYIRQFNILFEDIYWEIISKLKPLDTFGTETKFKVDRFTNNFQGLQKQPWKISEIIWSLRTWPHESLYNMNVGLLYCFVSRKKTTLERFTVNHGLVREAGTEMTSFLKVS